LTILTLAASQPRVDNNMIFFAPMGKNLAKDGSSKIDRVFMGFVE
jgi:hypothetical protein